MLTNISYRLKNLLGLKIVKFFVYVFLFIFFSNYLLSIFVSKFVFLSFNYYIISFVFFYFNLKMLLYIIDTYDHAQFQIGFSNFSIKIVSLIVFSILVYFIGSDLKLVFVVIWLAISILFFVDVRVSLLFAINLIIIVPFQLLLKDNVSADNLAVFAYYFLIISFLNYLQNYFILGDPDK